MNNVKLLLSCERTRRNATLCLSVEMSGGKMWLQQRVVKSSGWVRGCGCRAGGLGGWGGLSLQMSLYMHMSLDVFQPSALDYTSRQKR